MTQKADANRQASYTGPWCEAEPRLSGGQLSLPSLGARSLWFFVIAGLLVLLPLAAASLGDDGGAQSSQDHPAVSPATIGRSSENHDQPEATETTLRKVHPTEAASLQDRSDNIRAPGPSLPPAPRSVIGATEDEPDSQDFPTPAPQELEAGTPSTGLKDEADLIRAISTPMLVPTSPFSPGGDKPEEAQPPPSQADEVLERATDKREETHLLRKEDSQNERRLRDSPASDRPEGGP